MQRSNCHGIIQFSRYRKCKNADGIRPYALSVTKFMLFVTFFCCFDMKHAKNVIYCILYLSRAITEVAKEIILDTASKSNFTGNEKSN